MHLTIEISEQVGAELRKRAAAAGVSAEELSRRTLEQAFQEPGPEESEPAERSDRGSLTERVARAWTEHT